MDEDQELSELSSSNGSNQDKQRLLGQSDLSNENVNHSHGDQYYEMPPYGVDADADDRLLNDPNQQNSQPGGDHKPKQGYDEFNYDVEDLAGQGDRSGFDDDYSERNTSQGAYPQQSPYRNKGRSSHRGSGSGRQRRHRRDYGGGEQIHGLKNSIKFIAMLMMPLAILAALFVVVTKASGSSHDARLDSPDAAPTGLTYPSGFDMTVNWGSISPYFESGPAFGDLGDSKGADSNGGGSGSSSNNGNLHKNELYGIPSQCKLSQVHVLHRHAQRYPTKGRSKRMIATAEKINAMNANDIKPAAKYLQWMTKWSYQLGTELLTAPGVSTEFKSGSDFWASHGRLLFEPAEDSSEENGSKLNLFYSKDMTYNGTNPGKLVIRATDQSRIQTSARAWAAGFFGLYGGQDYTQYEKDSEVYDLVLQSETLGYNSTLASYVACPNAINLKMLKTKEKINQWIDSYLEHAVIRLQKVLPGIENITAQDVYGMQDLCSFETAAFGSSPFCGLFTENEWRGYEYAADLDFYYDTSFGSYVGAAEGAGWLYELKSRLEQHTIPTSRAAYGVNTTEDGSESTFPLHQPVYLDMTHDSVIMSVLTALDFDFLKKKLPFDSMPVPRQFIVSRLTPFGARLYIEVLECGDATQVRIKLNNRIVPLGHLSGCPASNDGLCPFEGFMKSLDKRLKAIDFDTICYGEMKLDDEEEH